MNEDLRCPHCGVTPDELHISDYPSPEGLPRAVWGVTHAPGCPDYVDLESMPAAEYEYDHDTGVVRRLGSETDGLD